MNITYKDIAALLNKADIEGYIALGAPADEYDSEAEALVLAFGELSEAEITVENIAVIVTAAWQQSFDLDGSDIAMRRADIQNFAQAVVTLNAKK